MPVLPARPAPAPVPQRPRRRLGQPLTGRRLRGVPRRLPQPCLKPSDPLQRPIQLRPRLRQFRAQRHHQRGKHLIRRRALISRHTGTLQPGKPDAGSRSKPVCGTSSAPSGSHFVIVSARKLIDRCRACLHLPSRRREARAPDLMAHQPPLPGRRPMAGQHMADSRMAPPPGSCGRYRIDSYSYATLDPVHHASHWRRTHLPPMVRRSRRRCEPAPTIACPRPAAFTRRRQLRPNGEPDQLRMI